MACQAILRIAAKGVILIDATGDDTLKSVCFLLYPDNLFELQDNSLSNSVFPVQFGVFDIYRNNLKGEWCQWKAN
jgi:hypothetical protein